MDNIHKSMAISLKVTYKLLIIYRGWTNIDK